MNSFESRTTFSTTIGEKIEYDAVVHKTRSVVSNKVAMAEGQVPMDVGRVGEAHFEDAGGDHAEHEVDALPMNVQCHCCGGWGAAL